MMDMLKFKAVNDSDSERFKLLCECDIPKINKKYFRVKNNLVVGVSIHKNFLFTSPKKLLVCRISSISKFY